MKLTYEGIKDTTAYEKANISLPKFQPEKMVENTMQSPAWVHFGAGNIFRGFIAKLQNTLLNENLATSGIVAVETFDFEVIDEIYKPFDNMTLMVTLKADGSTEKEVLAAIAQGLKASADFPQDMSRLKEIFCSSSLQLVSFTVTEKGYSLYNMKGELFPVVAADALNGPKSCKHVMSIVTALLNERFINGGAPIAVVSMDNCSHNGEKLRNAVLDIAKRWLEKGFVNSEFISWLSDEKQVSFPWSMIDKITPRPAKEIELLLTELGLENMQPIITSKNTYIAPFVNAEAPQYLVVEDNFPNSRAQLEKAGVIFTTRQRVNDVERMKVTTCLNPLHTALAIFGCLLSYTSISDEMADVQLKKLVENIGYVEGMPVVTDPKIIDPRSFISEVINERLCNPFIPDTPQRIATDTSQKMAIRFGETIKAYAGSETLSPESLMFIPLTIAGWLRYLTAINDEGCAFEPSSDPMLKELQEKVKSNHIDDILSNKTLFGCDLVALGLSEKIKNMFFDMNSGKGAVRKALIKYL